MKPISTYLFSLLALVLLSGNVSLHGQLQSAGKIMGDFRTLNAADVIYMLPPLHPLQTEALEQESSEYDFKALKFAIERPISISPLSQGVWTQVESYRVWRAHIISPGAVSLGLIFDTFHLEEGVQLMIYDPEKTQVKGAYTAKNNKASGIFALGHIPGEEVIVELQVPVHLENYGVLSLGSLSHAFLPTALYGTLDGRYGRSQPCEIDVNCGEGAQWQLEKQSVVRFYTASQYCTGVMLNNTAYNGEPLLLTAQHCIFDESSAASAIFVFSYESPSCFGEDGSVAMSISGAESLSIGDSIDFSLVRLSLPPPDDFNVFYSGWDLTSSPSGPSTALHHPEGDVKKISFDYEAPEATVDKEQIPPQFWDLLSNSFWWIKQWDEGSTEPGSSGSPLFTPNSKVIGVLSFGSAKCGDSIGYDVETDRVIYSKQNNVDDYYTRLDVAWDYRDDADRSLQQWLDPTGSGLRSIEGLHPSGVEERRTQMGSQFSLWPNPTGRELWFSSRTLGEGDATYRIFDLRGAIVMEKNIRLPGPVKVNVGELQEGFYLLLIEYGTTKEMLKFVKSK